MNKQDILKLLNSHGDDICLDRLIHQLQELAATRINSTSDVGLPSASPTQFDRIYVLSDLHIPPEPMLGNFSPAAGQKLIQWTQNRINDPEPRKAIVLNGDIVDFLHIKDRPLTMVLSDIGAFVTEALNKLESEHPFLRKWKALLAEFAAQGGHVVVIPGNHDLELLHPAAADVFCRWIAGTHPTQRVPSWIQVHRDTIDWRAHVGAWDVIVTHGDQFDVDNKVDHQAIRHAIETNKASVPLPPGSNIVLNALRPFKTACFNMSPQPRFSFIDALKPESPTVILVLLALAPELVIQSAIPSLPTLGVLFLNRLRKKLTREITTLGLPQLPGESDNSNSPLQPAVSAAVDSFISSLDDRLQRSSATYNKDVQNILSDFHSHVSNLRLQSDHLSTLSRTNNIRALLLRAGLNYYKTQDMYTDFMDPTMSSDYDRRLVRAYSAPEVVSRIVIAGHTHAPRVLHQTQQYSYVNTGTWTPIVNLANYKDVGELLDNLEDGAFATVNRFPWAEITSAGVQLHFEATHE